MACKYDKESALCKTLKPDEIKAKYVLNDNEINVMNWLYKQQVDKEGFLWDYFYGQKKLGLQILGSLKKKGLIYSVIGMPGWIGTDIKV